MASTKPVDRWVNVRLTKKEHGEMRARAAESMRSMSGWVRVAVVEKLERDKGIKGEEA